MNDFVDFLLFSFWVAVTGLPDSCWSKFLPLSLDPLTQWWTALISSVSLPLAASGDESFIFVSWKLNNCLLFDTVRHGWELVIHFELNTTQTSAFTKPYTMTNSSSRNSEKVGTSSTSGPHFLPDIPLWRHYFANALCVSVIY
jgi:hypothetical protein